MKGRLPIVMGVVVGVAGFTGGAQAETLLEALATAYSNNPSLQAGRAGLRAVDESVPQALSTWRPTVSLSQTYGRERTFSNTRTGKRTAVRSPRSTALTITQNLYRGGRTESSTDSAESSVKATRASLIATEQGILLNAAIAYANVYRDQAVLELNISNEQVLRRQLEATKDRFEVGELTRTDVSQATARLAGSTADRVQSEGSLKASRAAYYNAVGAMPEKLEKPLPLNSLPVNEGVAVELALKQHPDILAAVHKEEGSNADVKTVRGELLPTLSVTGTISRADQATTNTSRSEEKSIKGTLSVPLYQSGAVYSRLRAAKQTVSQNRLNIKQGRRDITESARQSWVSVVTAKARITSFFAQIKAAEVALEGVQREAQVGSRTVLDVLDAEQELLDAKVSLVRAQRDLVAATAQLKEATGELTAKHLALDVPLYDVNKHYKEVRDSWVGGTSSGDSDSKK